MGLGHLNIPIGAAKLRSRSRFRVEAARRLACAQTPSVTQGSVHICTTRQIHWNDLRVGGGAGVMQVVAGISMISL